MPRKAGPARPVGNCRRVPLVSDASNTDSLGSGELRPAGERFAFPRAARPPCVPTERLAIPGTLRLPAAALPVRAGALREGGVSSGASACANVVTVLLADDGIWPSPPTYAGLSVSSSSTQSDSSPMLSECRPENTSRIPGTSGG